MAIFTKFDDLINQVFDEDKTEEENRKVAATKLKEKFEEPLRGYSFPPRAYVCFECTSSLGKPITRLMPHPALHEDEGSHQKQVKELIDQTASSIDDLALKILFVTVQRNNMDVCIKYAVNM